MSTLKYFKLAKPTDHLPDPEGTLSSKLPSPAIASANSEVHSVIAIHYFPTCEVLHRAASCGFYLQKLLSIVWRNSPNFLPLN